MKPERTGPETSVIHRDETFLRLSAAAVAGLLLLLSLMALAPFTAQAAGTFVDDDGSTFEADIEWIAAAGITKGCNPPINDRFCPDDYVTRGQMAAFLHRALDDILTPGPPVEYIDDNGNTFEADIEWLGATGITKGCNPPTNNRFCPDDYVTRGQMAAFLHRALDDILTPGPPVEYIDDNGNTFEADIEWLGATGITKGCNPPTNNRFCPDDYVTRGQMAAFLHRALDPGGGSTTTTTTTPGSTTSTSEGSTTTSSSTTTTTIGGPPVWIPIVDGSGPTARHEAGFVEDGNGNGFFLLGGRETQSVQHFDLSGQVWQTTSTASEKLHHFQPVPFNGLIYLMGAMEGNCCFAENEKPVATLKILDPSTGEISNGPGIPAKHQQGAAGAVAHGEWIYVAGGITGGHGDDDTRVGDPGGSVTTNLLTFSRYKPSTNTWEELPDIPRGRDHFQAVAVGDRIYLVGGRTTETPFPNFWKQPAQIPEVDVFDISDMEWVTHTIQPLAVPRAGAMAAALGAHIYLIGGEGGDGHDQNGDPAHNRVDILDTVNETWSTGPTLSPPRHGTGAAVCADDIYIAAGAKTRGGQDPVDDFHALDTEGDGLDCLP